MNHIHSEILAIHGCIVRDQPVKLLINAATRTGMYRTCRTLIESKLS